LTVLTFRTYGQETSKKAQKISEKMPGIWLVKSAIVNHEVFTIEVPQLLNDTIIFNKNNEFKMIAYSSSESPMSRIIGSWKISDSGNLLISNLSSDPPFGYEE